MRNISTIEDGDVAAQMKAGNLKAGSSKARKIGNQIEENGEGRGEDILRLLIG